MYFEALQQLSLDRTRRLREEAEAERLAVQARGRRQRRRQRLSLHAALGLMLRSGRPVSRQGTRLDHPRERR